jgi:hypothetical protein
MIRHLQNPRNGATLSLPKFNFKKNPSRFVPYVVAPVVVDGFVVVGCAVTFVLVCAVLVVGGVR